MVTVTTRVKQRSVFLLIYSLFPNYLLTALDDDAAGAGRGGCALQGVGRTLRDGHDAG